MKKTLTTLAIAGSMTFLGAGVAQAQTAEYPPETVVAAGAVDDALVAPGEPFTFSGAGFAANTPIEITASNEEANAAGLGTGFGAGIGLGAGVMGVIVPAAVVTADSETDSEGRFSEELVLEEEGTYTVSGTGLDADGETERTVVATVVVDAAAAQAEDDPTNPAANPVEGDPVESVADPAADDGANDDAAANGDQLADTGLDSSALLWGGAGVLALGAGATAVVVSRRKNA